MKRIRCYLPNVLLSFLLVFCLMGTEGLLLVKYAALRPQTFAAVAQQQALADKAYATLTKEFKTRSNSTGIPAEVYLDAIGTDMLSKGITDSTAGALAYLNGETDSYQFTMDFSALEASVTAFFEQYAEENGYEKDTVYEAKVASAIEEAEAEILFVADTFKLSVIQKNGWLEKARHYMGWLDKGLLLCAGSTLLVVVVLVLCNRRQKPFLCYWTGLSACIAGILLLVPCIYVKATDYFSSFVIKDPQIFAAVIGYLNRMTTLLTITAGITAAVGVLLLCCFAAVSRHSTAPET